jgi:hypothetical protein
MRVYRALTLVPFLIVVAFLVVLGDKVGWGLSAAVFGVIVVGAGSRARAQTADEDS